MSVVVQDISWFIVQVLKVYIVLVKVIRLIEVVQIVLWKCCYEFFKICIMVEDIGKCVVFGFVGFKESDVVVRLVFVKLMLKCKK